jgi:translation initiation factor IF-1
LHSPGFVPIWAEPTSPATDWGLFRARFPFKLLARASRRPVARGPHVRRAPKEIERMAKEATLTVEGLIDEIYPDGRFGVRLDNDHRVIAYTAGKMRRFRIRSVVGDRVHVEMTPYDLTKGRLVFRERTPGQGPGGGRRPGAKR